MVKVLHIGDTLLLIRARINIGFIKSEDKWYMIDSGLDDDQARRALNSVSDKIKHIEALLNTHSHADHIGGNNYVSKRLGIPIYSSRAEVAIGLDPILEPAVLYGGYPLRELRNKLLMAKPSRMNIIDDINLPLEVVDLKGHSPGMIGFMNDEIIYVGDAYLEPSLVKKHKLLYNYDPKEALNTLNKLEELSPKGLIFVPSHGDPSSDPTDVIEFNREAIIRVKEILNDLLIKKHSFSELVSKVFKSLELNITDISLYYLYESALKGYLTWMYDSEEIIISIESNKVFYQLARR